MRRALVKLVLSASVLVLILPIAGSPASSAGTPVTWTIMVYMAANSTPELPWLQNLNAMEAGLQAPGTNIIALVDPAGGGNSTLYKISHDPGGENSALVSQIIDDGGAVIPRPTNNSDMGSPATLSSFISFSITHYPADRYALDLWGHAATWYGVCPDGTDILTLPELGTALSDAVGLLGRPLDLIAVDACSEASLEMIFEIHDYAKYFVASEMNIPSQGLPYHQILDSLASNVNTTGAGLGVAIAEEYLTWARNNSFYSATMAVFDLTKVHPFIEAFDDWVGLGMRYEGMFHSVMRGAFNSSEHYETAWQDDFGSIASHLASSSVPVELRLKTNQTMGAFIQMRVYWGSYDNADAVDLIRATEPTGAVVYLPSTDYADRRYTDLRFASSGWFEYSHMLRRVASSNASTEIPSMSFGSSEDLGAGLYDTVFLNWSASYEHLEVWVFREQPDGLVLCGLYSSAGDNITIHDSTAVGDLVLSASAGSEKTAVSYACLGPVPVTGHVFLGLRINGTIPSGSDLHLVIVTATRTIFQNMTFQDSVFHIDLLTPRDVAIGDTIRVNVTVGDRLVGNGSVTLDSTSAMMEIDVREKPATSSGWPLIVGMIALAAVLVAVFVVLLRREKRRTAG